MARRKKSGRQSATFDSPVPEREALSLPEALAFFAPVLDGQSWMSRPPRDDYIPDAREQLIALGVYPRFTSRRYRVAGPVVADASRQPRRDPVARGNLRLPGEKYEDCLARVRQNARRRAVLLQSGKGGRNGVRQYRRHRDPCK